MPEPIDDKPRCFGSHTELYAHYHDTEWGVPVQDDKMLFEMLILEGAHAGLSWETILKKREGYRAVFHDFDVERVAAMSDAELDDALQNPAIVTIGYPNARAYRRQTPLFRIAHRALRPLP